MLLCLASKFVTAAAASPPQQLGGDRGVSHQKCVATSKRNLEKINSNFSVRNCRKETLSPRKVSTVTTFLWKCPSSQSANVATLPRRLMLNKSSLALSLGGWEVVHQQVKWPLFSDPLWDFPLKNFSLSPSHLLSVSNPPHFRCVPVSVCVCNFRITWRSQTVTSSARESVAMLQPSTNNNLCLPLDWRLIYLLCK